MGTRQPAPGEGPQHAPPPACFWHVSATHTRVSPWGWGCTAQLHRRLTPHTGSRRAAPRPPRGRVSPTSAHCPPLPGPRATPSLRPCPPPTSPQQEACFPQKRSSPRTSQRLGRPARRAPHRLAGQGHAGRRHQRAAGTCREPCRRGPDSPGAHTTDLSEHRLQNPNRQDSACQRPLPPRKAPAVRAELLAPRMSCLRAPRWAAGAPAPARRSPSTARRPSRAGPRRASRPRVPADGDGP